MDLDISRKLVLVSINISILNLTSQIINNIFVGFKTPVAAIEGQYIDKKCPFTSNVTIRGTIFK